MERTFTEKCRSCGAVNRIPESRQGMSGHCGACSAALPPLHLSPVPLGEGTFDRFLAEYDAPVLAEFWAPW